MNYQIIYLAEPTAARRRIPFFLASTADGHSPVTGTIFAAADLQVSQNGSAEANSAGTVTELGGGVYFYEATIAEVATPGFLTLRALPVGARGRSMVQVVAVNVNDAFALGLANLDAAVTSRAAPSEILATPANLLLTDAGGRVTLVPTQEDAIVDKVWDELQAGHVVAGSFGKRLDADVSTRAVPGSAMTLTSGERDAVANALLNLADGIELGYTPKQALRLIAAVLCGKASGGPTNIIFRNMGDTANRVVTIADGNGNRTTVTLLP
jgi:hypothetical protein